MLLTFVCKKPEETLGGLVMSMPRCVRPVLVAQGGPRQHHAEAVHTHATARSFINFSGARELGASQQPTRTASKLSKPWSLTLKLEE